MKKLGLVALGAIGAVGAVALYEYLRREGVVDQVKGEAKRYAGSATNDRKLEAEGMLDVGKGKTREVVEDVKDAAKDTVKDIKDAFKD